MVWAGGDATATRVAGVDCSGKKFVAGDIRAILRYPAGAVAGSAGRCCHLSSRMDVSLPLGLTPGGTVVQPYRALRVGRPGVVTWLSKRQSKVPHIQGLLWLWGLCEARNGYSVVSTYM